MRDWSIKFLAGLARTGNVTIAAREAHIVRQTAYARRAADEEFAASWENAVEEAGDLLEEEARRRAHDGTLKPVFHQGVECGQIREYSDTLLIFLLKGTKPQKYVERREITGAGGGAVQLRLLGEMSDDDLKRRTAELLEREVAQTLPDIS